MPDTISDKPDIVERLLPVIISYGLKLIGVVVLFIVGRWIARRIQHAVLDRSTHKGFDPTLGRFFSSLVGTAIVVLTLVACLSIFGVETASLAAVLGGAALAIGLAFQGSLSNFAAGIMLVIFRPFKVGDLVTLADVTGHVFEMGLFSTHIDTSDNRRVIVPNSNIFGSTIVNLSHHPKRRVDVPVGTDYGADLEVVRAVLAAAIQDIPGGLAEPVPAVFLKDLGASSVDWEVRVWCNTPDYWSVRQQCVVAVKRALDGAHIGIPVPQMDVHLDTSERKAA